jgi:hypothetical protein
LLNCLLFHGVRYCLVLPQVVEAFDVLSDEEQRAVYDKCRDYMVGWGMQGSLPACNIRESMLEAHSICSSWCT